MWSILFIVYVASTYHGEPAVSTQMIGNYQTLERCNRIAKQLELESSMGFRSAGPSDIKHTARCVQVKD